MFDSYISPRRTEYITRRVDITENRAPTDESIKLLREMEAAAEAKRVAVMKLDANHLSGVVEVWNDFSCDRVYARAIFDLNGQRLTAQVDTHPESDGFHKLEMMQALHAEIAKEVASKILGDGLKKMGGW